MSLKNIIYVIIALDIALPVSSHTDGGMAANMSEPHEPEPSDAYPATYFTLHDHQLTMLLHVFFMVLAWIALLPIATMLSLARSRYTNFARLVFTATNVVGLAFGILYKGSTPNLYPGSAHSAVGWIATCMAALQISHLVAFLTTQLLRRLPGQRLAGIRRHVLGVVRSDSQELNRYSGLPPQPTSGAAHMYSDVHDASSPDSSSLCGEEESPETILATEQQFLARYSTAIHGLCQAPNDVLAGSIFDSSPRARKVIVSIYKGIDRVILVVAFIAICTGIVTFWGLFQGRAIFNGIAHWIKGGVFFWLGILSLGRWCGSFADLGWAWNIRPSASHREYWSSAECVESALIFLYGSTNIFLEHLGGWGRAWTAHDLEHISITVLFIGGGLCGMFIEFIRVKGMRRSEQLVDSLGEASAKRGGVSTNPLPALVIFLMGGTMSSHEQASMVSTMIHKQWGNLLGAAAVARLVTYLIMYMKPPTSTSPSRPPTELIASFCLISGGILFMASSSDTVKGMIHYEINVMALYTVTMGLTGIMMAWVIGLLALKERASK